MYIWNIDKLKQALIKDTISEYEQFKYLLANIIIGPLPIQFKTLQYEYKSYWIVIHVITVCGIIYCFIKNNGKEGSHFLSKFLSVSFVINIRLFLFLLPLMFLVLIFAFAFDFGGLSSEAIEYIFAVGFSLFEIFYYWRVGYHINEVSLIKETI